MKLRLHSDKFLVSLNLCTPAGKVSRSLRVAHGLREGFRDSILFFLGVRGILLEEMDSTRTVQRVLSKH